MPSSTESTGGTSGFWGCRALRPDGSMSAFYGVQSSAHDDRERIELPEPEAVAAVGGDGTCVVHCDAGGRAHTIEILPHMAPKAPPVWFAEIEEVDAAPPAATLLAFVGHDVEKGRLLDRSALRQVAVRSEDQLGALRWYPATGEIDQIYVSPHARRQNVASALLVAASTLSATRGWGSMWSDGQRTAEGDRLLRGRPTWSSRAGELTHLAPPMTPFGDRIG